MTQAAVCTQNLLLIYYNTAIVWVSTSLSREEVANDAHVASFATIVSLASSIISSAQRGPPLHSFSFETELIAPIYWTAQKCRHPILRRAAVKLLMKNELKNRRENLWHSNEAIAVALRAIEVEEEKMERSVVMDCESPMGQSAATTAAQNSPGSDTSSKGSYRSSSYIVPIFQPPTISVSELEEEEQRREETLDFNTPPSGATETGERRHGSSLASVLDVAADRAQLESPYGISEDCRIKNVLIGSREANGVWVTIFRDPQFAEEQWDVRKEFVRFL
ncbi:hypothetical protein NQ176_g9333 [Zarea fungicola]|uniref:Uncharacterized protein n=1 Tax=Zarea fungicola TaxID=93591 RepID=A0ACC1MN72_9HYPO|nr:hypothetical protein NQ176_g9333 [Lecanicillium fungicola]